MATVDKLLPDLYNLLQQLETYDDYTVVLEEVKMARKRLWHSQKDARDRAAREENRERRERIRNAEASADAVGRKR